jgi:cobalamin biosynthesis protein CobD/CbiB
MNHYMLHALRLALLVAGLAMLIWVLSLTAAALVHPLVWWVLLFLAAVTLFTTQLTIWGSKRFPSSFNAFFFVGMIIRFFAAIIFITVVVVTGIQAVLLFIGNFFVLYLCFQLFEITSLLTNLRPHLENQGNEAKK